ncbi:ABC transporter ATP-binding protein [Ornithinimicrobium humiphilum]|uniref:Teichoic acid transport system ATP-binding protein n=1 Tax=Ornithinimicrobium humiphilum TaxID=125288 RepID=A0A543KJE7_9MICO|nr:ABC transporter ATP-binding protein [Ornithinimicrobium humiphilum]TQM95174.1 teichoic acid transport system ATP-binding protein [Ornithinimicrobium humiphilum]
MAAPETAPTPGGDADGRVPSVVCSGVSITYRVYGVGREESDEEGALRRLLSRSTRGVGRREVHAVRDVSFVAYRGESIGIVGSNGSGKSTLLRTIAGLVPPTSGKLWLGGKAALLGVNAVLMPKLTGRENIWIGAQALGLTPGQVRAAFDDIVEFADIGDFLDLPMASYSSGMGARLRFAISTAVTPDILVVDEALSTGDAHFRAKANERITRIREQAGTVFIVSHSDKTIQTMCSRALWIDKGRLLADGDPVAVNGLYARKYGKHRHVWRERFEEARRLEETEGPEAARAYLARWDRSLDS